MPWQGGQCIYDLYINEIKSFPVNTYQKWKIKLNIDISKNDFLNLSNTMYSCTKSTKLKETFNTEFYIHH